LANVPNVHGELYENFMLARRSLLNIQALKTGHMVEIVFIVIIILMLIGSLPTWPYSRTWDYYPSSLLGVILALLLMLILSGRI
jgi:low affinity Fe/Cu permease